MFDEFGGLKMITDLYRVETFFDKLLALMYDMLMYDVWQKSDIFYKWTD